MTYLQVSCAITQKSDSGREYFMLASGVFLDKWACLCPSKILYNIEPSLYFLILQLVLTTFNFSNNWVISLWKKVKVKSLAQSCLTLCDPVDCSLPGSSVHGIFQAIVLQWIAFILFPLCMFSCLHFWVPFLSFIKMVIVCLFVHLFIFDLHLIGIVTKPNLDQLTQHAGNLSYWHQVVVKEITAFIARQPAWCQAKRMGSSCSKLPNSPMALKEGLSEATWGIRVARL